MTQTATMLEAIAQAMMSEKRAADFYRDAADKAKSPRGKNMLQQLADFEIGHYEALAKLRESLEGGGDPEVDYPGRAFERVPAEATGEEASKETNLDEVNEILELAIATESAAHDSYAELAESTDDPMLKTFFGQLAAEETLHRRILSDEFYQLNNSGGEWVWME